MSIHLGEFVYSLKGRDAGRCFIVISDDGEFLYVCDGKHRKVLTPKKKRVKHLGFTGDADSFITEKLLGGDKVTNNEVKAAIRRYKDRKDI